MPSPILPRASAALAHIIAPRCTPLPAAQRLCHRRSYQGPPASLRTSPSASLSAFYQRLNGRFTDRAKGLRPTLRTSPRSSLQQSYQRLHGSVITDLTKGPAALLRTSLFASRGAFTSGSTALPSPILPRASAALAHVTVRVVKRSSTAQRQVHRSYQGPRSALAHITVRVPERLYQRAKRLCHRRSLPRASAARAALFASLSALINGSTAGSPISTPSHRLFTVQ